MLGFDRIWQPPARFLDRIHFVEIWVRKCSSFEEERRADREFWAALTPEQRVAAVEELRQEWARTRGTDEDLQGLRRSARVLQRTRR